MEKGSKAVFYRKFVSKNLTTRSLWCASHDILECCGNMLVIMLYVATMHARSAGEKSVMFSASPRACKPVPVLEGTGICRVHFALQGALIALRK